MPNCQPAQIIYTFKYGNVKATVTKGYATQERFLKQIRLNPPKSAKNPNA